MKLTPWLGGPRGALLHIAVLLVGCGVYQSGGRKPLSWIGSWKEALDVATGSLWFLGPLCAGLACLAYVRVQASGIAPLVVQAPRGRLAWALPAVAVWSLGTAVVLLEVGVMTTVAAVDGARPYYAELWIVIPALTVLAAEVAIGAAIGALGRSIWLAPVAVVVTFGLQFLTYMYLLPMLFLAGGGRSGMAGFTYAVWPNVGQAVATAGLAVGVLGLSNPALLRIRGWYRYVVAVSAAVGVATSLALPSGDEARIKLVAQPEYACAGSAPEVCMYAETVRPLSDLAAKMHRFAQPLVAIGAETPQRFAVTYIGDERPWGPDDGVLVLGDSHLDPTVPTYDVIDSLVLPARCEADWSSAGGPPDEVFAARQLLRVWLLIESGVVPAEELDRLDDPPAESVLWDYYPAWREGWHIAGWLTDDTGQRDEWVRSTYAMLRRCDYEKVRPPDGYVLW